MIDPAALEAAGQGHLVRAVERLDGARRDALERQIAALDLPQLRRLIAEVATGDEPHELGLLQPPEVIPAPVAGRDDERERAARAAGAAHLRAGRVAVVMLAGGQGTRLGFEGPKGAFPFAPVTGTTLFAHHAATIAALRARYATALPWYIMTAPHNHEQTEAIFAAADRFGLAAGSVRLFSQGVLPAVDRHTGAILLEAPDRLALSPDGHGGIFPALARAGILQELAEQGIATIVTANVDNPLLRIARAEFLGHHLLTGAEMSNIVVRKHDPEERVGVVAMRDGRTVLVEYSDLPAELAAARADDGGLRFWAGSVAAHAVQREFAARLTDGLPYHRAIKRVPYVDDGGRLVTPDEPNAVKFEAFMFDALPLAARATSVESLRADEFSPIKNADGSDSPATARRDLNRRNARWLRAAGVEVAVSTDGDPPVDIEIDPRVALDADELRQRLPAGFAPVPGEPIVLRPD